MNVLIRKITMKEDIMMISITNIMKKVRQKLSHLPTSRFSQSISVGFSAQVILTLVNLVFFLRITRRFHLCLFMKVCWPKHLRTCEILLKVIKAPCLGRSFIVLRFGWFFHILVSTLLSWSLNFFSFLSFSNLVFSSSLLAFSIYS